MSIVQQLEEKHPTDFRCAQDGCVENVEQLLRQHAGLIVLIVGSTSISGRLNLTAHQPNKALTVRQTTCRDAGAR